jgi:hypothetical protein
MFLKEMPLYSLYLKKMESVGSLEPRDLGSILGGAQAISGPM